MIQIFSTYRRLIAALLTGWMTIIIISGVVFIHKEVTSKGEIVTHIHPYDFTKKTPKHHHTSDAEIQYLNVLFHGSFIETDFGAFEAPLFHEFPYVFYTPYYCTYHSYTPQQRHLRGPPLHS